MSRQITILCDGGLGNRLSGLVGGLLVSQQLGLEPVISWPENNWCGAGFADLFDATDWRVNDQNVFEVFESNLASTFIIHENQTNFKLSNYLPHTPDSIQQARLHVNDLVYYHNKVPAYFANNQVVQQLSRLHINSGITDMVNEFCVANQINHHVAGLHLRKTENFNLDETTLYQQVISTPKQRYFVCSDDQDTQEKFSSLPNVCARAKTSYVEKMVPGSWYETVTDTDGRSTKYNISRSKQSVIEAFVDMLILSRTWIRPTVKSSFLNFARYFAQVDTMLNNNDHGHNESSST